MQEIRQKKAVLTALGITEHHVGRRYDLGDKHGYMEATVEYALRRPELREKFLCYLQQIVK